MHDIFVNGSSWLVTALIKLGMMFVSGIVYRLRFAEERIPGKAKKLRTLSMGVIKAFGCAAILNTKKI